jgi:two-component system sensor histidine kinase AlgZ
VQPKLSPLSYQQGVFAVNGLVVLWMLAIYFMGGELYHPLGSTSNAFDALRYLVLSLAVCNLLLFYFRLRAQVLSRALHDAQLQVLRARIRPHFLFNTLNTVLAIVRSQPKQAETALEDMADLFRMAMSDSEDLVPLSQEIELARQYLALEQLRLSDRLHVNWHIDLLPDDTLIPPLLLQPLLENAVYHGVEPLIAGGTIDIVMRHKGKEFQIKVENTSTPQQAFPHAGNKMALQNIRERLSLLFDVEAHYEVEKGQDFYRVTITLPFLARRTS